MPTKPMDEKKRKKRVLLGEGWPIYRQNDSKTAYEWIGIEMPGRQMTHFEMLGATKIRLIAEILP